MDYAGKVAVVTASGNGIGRAVVLEFARRGSAVLVSDYDGEAAGRVAAEIVAAGGEATARRCDVTSDADVRALADDAFDHWGRVDVLMNHAGASIAGPCHEGFARRLALGVRRQHPGSGARRSGIPAPNGQAG